MVENSFIEQTNSDATSASIVRVRLSPFHNLRIPTAFSPSTTSESIESADLNQHISILENAISDRGNSAKLYDELAKAIEKVVCHLGEITTENSKFFLSGASSIISRRLLGPVIKFRGANKLNTALNNAKPLDYLSYDYNEMFADEDLQSAGENAIVIDEYVGLAEKAKHVFKKTSANQVSISAMLPRDLNETVMLSAMKERLFLGTLDNTVFAYLQALCQTTSLAVRVSLNGPVTRQEPKNRWNYDLLKDKDRELHSRLVNLVSDNIHNCQNETILRFS